MPMKKAVFCKQYAIIMSNLVILLETETKKFYKLFNSFLVIKLT